MTEVSEHDLATLEKLPVIRDLLGESPPEPCLDIGVGTGFTTRRAFPGRRTVALDAWLPNLERLRARLDPRERGLVSCLGGTGERLPLRAESVGTVLCSEVLEHVVDDRALLHEIARVLRPGGIAVVTVPSLHFGFDSYLRLFGVRTVHDSPGPECHVRPGYTTEGLRALARGAGLEVEASRHLFRPVAKLLLDTVSLAHLIYQRAVHGRRSWAWSDVAAAEGGLVLGVYGVVVPLLRLLACADLLFPTEGGFGVAMRLRKTVPRGAPAVSG